MNIPKTMRALVAHGQGKYALETIPVPKVGADDILMKVEACGICAGDVKATHPNRSSIFRKQRASTPCGH